MTGRCKCGKEYDVGYHGFMGRKVSSFYYCFSCFNKRNETGNISVEETLVKTRRYNKTGKFSTLNSEKDQGTSKPKNTPVVS